jgi:hypothetical protein
MDRIGGQGFRLQYRDSMYGKWATCTANEEPVRIQYKCLVVPIYVFPELKLRGDVVIFKTEL